MVTENLSARQNEGDGKCGKNVGKILCGREWEALWEVSWLVGQHYMQKDVLCPHTELSGAALSSSPRSAAGQPWPRPCRESCVGRQEGDDDSSGL